LISNCIEVCYKEGNRPRGFKACVFNTDMLISLHAQTTALPSALHLEVLWDVIG